MEVTRKSGRRPEPPRGWEGLGGAEIETVAMRTPEGHGFWNAATVPGVYGKYFEDFVTFIEYLINAHF